MSYSSNGSTKLSLFAARQCKQRDATKDSAPRWRLVVDCFFGDLLFSSRGHFVNPHSIGTRSFCVCGESTQAFFRVFTLGPNSFFVEKLSCRAGKELTGKRKCWSRGVTSMRHECKLHSMSISASSSHPARHTSRHFKYQGHSETAFVFLGRWYGSNHRTEDLAVSWPCMAQAFAHWLVRWCQIRP